MVGGAPMATERMSVAPIDYDSICSGVRDLVRELRETHHLETCDSGDGEHFAKGMEGALPYRHVFIQVEYTCMIATVWSLAAQYPTSRIELSWSPDETPMILVLPDGYDKALDL